MTVFALTIFTSAFLLFQVQPLAGRFILPSFGGTPAVWTTCMLFFQVLLLLGYAYAHGLSVLLKPRHQAWLHALVVVAALLSLPIIPPEALFDALSGTAPISAIFLLLAASAGLPYFVLSATGPLAQHWFARSFPGTSPYRLYALSNGGSLLALISYPLVFEPFLRLQVQAWLWAILFLLFALGIFACSRIQSRAGDFQAGEAQDGVSGALRPGWGRILLWLGLSAAGSAMLLATTNQLCQDVASVPFLWVLPLALYLLSFILCFDNPRGYDRRCWISLLALLVPGGWTLFYLENFWLGVPFTAQLLLYSAVLLSCCMACHGEMVRSKPAPRHLTLFYMVMSLGGALGGVLVGLVAPLVFSGFWEYGIALGACLVLPLLAQGLLAPESAEGARLRNALAALVVVQAVCFAGVSAWAGGVKGQAGKNLFQTRNFYGVLRVQEAEENGHGVRRMVHGRITHGMQFMEPAMRGRPTSYYGLQSGVGLVLSHESALPRRVGVVGLGAGTLAVYGRPGDLYAFYEINPEVIASAYRDFSFLGDSAAEVRVHEGDGRILLEKQPGQGFDVLAVDAFSGDAIPMHLLTREFFEICLRHLRPGGLLLFHITNRYLDLSPVLRGLARELGFEAVHLRSESDSALGTSRASWVLLSSDRAFLARPEILSAASPWPGEPPLEPLVWTDDFAGLWQVLKRQARGN